jgi:GAF domain-containing protein/anti-sigma regulatory factor (Ser/Thr protein kinase)
MPPQVSTIGADQESWRTVEELKRELGEGRDQQRATTEILSVISRSPTDAQPVFDTIAASATRLCDGLYSVVFRFDGEMITVAADSGVSPRASAIIRRAYPAPPGRGTMASRALLERRVITLTDAQDDVANPAGAERARAIGYRAGLSVPLLRGDTAIGAINIVRREAIPFTDAQVELLKTFADQAVIAIENARLFEEVQARTRELQESLDQQTATSEVLSVISSSPGELMPVFQVMLENAVRICGAKIGNLALFDGRELRIAAFHGAPKSFEELRRRDPIIPLATSGLGRVVETKQLIHIADLAAEERFASSALVKLAGARTFVGVPMLKDNEPIGAIAIYRQQVRPFSEKQIELVKGFANQAVIAIENTRLLNELRESLAQQTGTADVLKVISRSAFDLQKVLDTVVESAAKLCDADVANIRRVDDGGLRYIAGYGYSTELTEYFKTHTPPAGRGTPSGRAIIEGRTIHVVDVLDDPEFTMQEAQKLTNYRTMLAVLLAQEGKVIGVLFLARTGPPRAFTPKQIELVETFADQAVIAIENTRLFEEVQARTRELTESLEFQTATSEVLNVISRSPAELQPVLNTIVETANRLCKADHAHVYRLQDGKYHLVAHNQTEHHFIEYLSKNPIGLDQLGSVTARAARACKTVHVPDSMQDPEYGHGPLTFSNDRTVLSVPLLREGAALGVVTVGRQTLLPFTSKEIELVESFADQAVIAIENTRLFEAEQASKRELSEALEYQTATTDVLNVISRSKFDLQPVLDSIVETAARLCACDMATIRRREGDVYVQLAGYGLPDDYAEYSRSANWHHAGRGSLVGRVLQEGKAIQIPDVLADPDYALREAQRRGEFRSLLGVPLLRGGDQIGIIVLMRRVVRPFSDKQIELVTAFADQAVIAIENTRLFEEVQARTAELAKTVEDLEIASQHKSQFVANMSHELRTPLAAILGYAELMQEGFYEPLGQKSLDALTRIRSNGKHLLGLINTVLDIAKIESGQFTLNMSEYAIESVVETVRSATESLAQNKKLVLTTDVAKKLPVGIGDEQRLTQVLLNLVGNAIKFTDTGEVRIAATAVNGHFNVTVTDTGPGIPEEHQARIFEQFHQVDSSNTKAKGGTGLGLAIAKQIVEMHGGRIWVESTVGKGSTFQMEIPSRAEFRKRAL